MKHKGLLITAIVLFVIGIIGSVGLFVFDSVLPTTVTTSGRTYQGTSSSYASLGEQIFLTGVGSDGSSIARSTTSASGMMGGNGCASCHGTNGQGGTFQMMMRGSTVDVPDITYKSLIANGFTDTKIGQAIRSGVDEQGQPLSGVMPRWQMSDTDLAYVITYLKELSV